MPRVACIGEGLVVLVSSSDGPLEDTTTFHRSIGGAEANVAIGLTDRGITAALLTRIGDDGFGRHLTSTLASLEVDISAIEVDLYRPTGLYVKERGGSTGLLTDLGVGNSRMHYYRSGSAGSAFSPDYLDRPSVLAICKNAEILHITGITPALSQGSLDMTMALLAKRQQNQIVSFDVNWRPALWQKRESVGAEVLATIIRRSDLVFVGAEEADDLYGITDPDILRELFPEPRWFVVKNDGQVATGFDGLMRVDVPALRVPVVEKIGAGDAFAAGFLAAMIEKRTLEECLLEAHRLAVSALNSVDDHVGSR